MQGKTRLPKQAKKVGLKIVTLNDKSETPVKLDDQTIEEVEDFTYIRSTISKNSGTTNDIKKRTNKTKQKKTFCRLRQIWKSRSLSRRKKDKNKKQKRKDNSNV